MSEKEPKDDTETPDATDEGRPISNRLLYVVAGNYRQAVIFAQSRGYHSTQMVNVDSREKVMGLRGITLHVVGTATEREDFHDIMREAQIRDFKVEYV